MLLLLHLVTFIKEETCGKRKGYQQVHGKTGFGKCKGESLKAKLLELKLKPSS